LSAAIPRPVSRKRIEDPMGIRTVLKTLVVCLGVTACYGVPARADTYSYTGAAYASCEGTFTCTGTAPQQTATFTFNDGT
jgi:hypothetical protein